MKINQQGISLIELIITMTIVSILAIVLMNFMVNWLQQHAITETRAALLSSAQDSLDSISDNIRLSSSADLNNRWQDPYSPSAPGNQLSWQSNTATLVLASAVENNAGDILFSDPSNYTSHKNNNIYFLKNGTLYLRVLASPVVGNRAKTTCPATNTTPTCLADRKLASNVTNFTVRYFNAANQQVTPTNARSVELSLTLKKEAFGQQIETSDKTRMVFRND